MGYNTTTPTQKQLEKIYGKLSGGGVQAARNDYWAKVPIHRDRENRRLAGIRRRRKVTGRDVSEFGQGLGAHKRPGRKRR
jgi:hypothetical protein